MHKTILVIIAALTLSMAGCAGSSSMAKSSYESGIRRTETPQPDIDGVKQSPITTTENYTRQTFEGKAVNEPGAITPPAVNMPGIESNDTSTRRESGSVLAGAMAAVNQLIKQLDYVIYIGGVIVLIGVGMFIASFYVPKISTLMCFSVIGIGVGMFFVPTMIVKYSWIIIPVVLAGFAWGWWHNGSLAKKGMAVGAGIAKVPTGFTKKEVAKATGSGITDMVIGDITPPADPRTA